MATRVHNPNPSIANYMFKFEFFYCEKKKKRDQDSHFVRTTIKSDWPTHNFILPTSYHLPTNFSNIKLFKENEAELAAM